MQAAMRGSTLVCIGYEHLLAFAATYLVVYVATDLSVHPVACLTLTPQPTSWEGPIDDKGNPTKREALVGEGTKYHTIQGPT